MTVMFNTTEFRQSVAPTEVAALVGLAARTVAPLWPLESAIAVNPLSEFEDLPFEKAVVAGGEMFGARSSLPLTAWRELMASGEVDQSALRDVAIRQLGGLGPALSPIGPNVTPLDLLMTRLLVMPAVSEAPSPELHPALAQLAKWCGVFFDQGGAAVPLPGREKGLYHGVLAMLAVDAQFQGRAEARRLLDVGHDSFAALAVAFDHFRVPSAERSGFLSKLMAMLPGWAGHVRWRSEHADPHFSSDAPASMADFLALLTVAARGAPELLDQRDRPAPQSQSLLAHFELPDTTAEKLPVKGRKVLHRIEAMTDGELGHLFMCAAEQGYRNSLGDRLEAAALRMIQTSERPAAQILFCIDVRSEPLRRRLEQYRGIETFGYAGFFGLPVAIQRPGEEYRTRRLPVLLQPQHDLMEAPVPGAEIAAAETLGLAARTRAAKALFETAKRGAATGFSTAEATGPLAALAMAARTFAPRFTRSVMSRLEHGAALSPAATMECAGAPGLTTSDKVAYAAAMFRLTGLKPSTARLVVLTGHGGCAVNNPYAAALDCGACGGHPGGGNARVMAAILNEVEVRRALAAEDLSLPDDTVFVAAEHNTTTDEVTIFDKQLIPASHLEELRVLEWQLANVGTANRASRAAKLDRSPDDLLTGAVHWGEVRPEWGLARNAAFIVAPRALTRDIDLDGRAFLHSYDWQADPDGTSLATILTAPMVVAQWINCQYLFSTIDNDRYGSGDKVTQNVVGRIGVVQGNGGDLKVGLPRQSLFRDDGTPYHVPQRLLTMIYAPRILVDRVVTKNDILMRLFGNGWVQLVVIEPRTGKAVRWLPDSELRSSQHRSTSAPEYSQ